MLRIKFQTILTTRSFLSSKWTSTISAKISKRVTDDNNALAARTIAPLFMEEQGSSANSCEAAFIWSPENWNWMIMASLWLVCIRLCSYCWDCWKYLSVIHTCFLDIINSCKHFRSNFWIFIGNLFTFIDKIFCSFLHCSTEDMGFFRPSFLLLRRAFLVYQSCHLATFQNLKTIL